MTEHKVSEKAVKGQINTKTKNKGAMERENEKKKNMMVISKKICVRAGMTF